MRPTRDPAHHRPVPSDVEAISALIMSYAERLDAGDLDGVAVLFAHATWRSPARAEPLRGAAAVRRAYDGVLLYDGIPCTRHMVTNLVVELEGPDRAAARSCFTVFQARPDFALQPIISGRYHDAFERVGGAWRFADRLILPDLVGDLSRHLRGPGPGR
ncbi:MAG TPA: nuclear transport factor 2 family protein [Verrucomicrobiae bacterium]|nr:nuclear transport factor 2 family protein [Verrucomicrobiae bacterium]